MWNSSYGRRKSKKKVTAKKPKTEFPFHLQRVVAELKTHEGPSSKVLPSRLLLNEFQADRVSLFTKDPIMVGDEVSFTMEYPKQFYVKTRVVSCQTIENLTIVSEETYRFRMVLEFLPTDDSEKETITKFYRELRDVHLKNSSSDERLRSKQAA